MKNVKESRVKMSVGFELCFGYNWEKLNTTIAEPFQLRLNRTNHKLIKFSMNTCSGDSYFDIDDTEDEDDELDDEIEENSPQDLKNIQKCKHFFDLIIQALYDDLNSVDLVFDENDDLLKTKI